MKDEYLEMRRRYEPETAKLLIVAESPPEGGKYFYNPNGLTSEPLFAEIMRQLGLLPATKHDGLLNLQRSGWVLVDATYEPVNQYASRQRNQIIERDYPKLREDLAQLTPDRSAPVILLKANVCRLLQNKLVSDHFNMLNHGIVIPFPSNGHQVRFRGPFRTALESTGMPAGTAVAARF
jgi:hypothetical protein